jgi:hypothetical protein
MKKRIIIVTITLALLTWLFSELQTEWQHMNTQIHDLQTEVVRLKSGLQTVREHNIIQDKLIEETVMAVHKTVPVVQQVTPVKTPEVNLPTVPIPFYIGAFETIKNFILR